MKQPLIRRDFVKQGLAVTAGIFAAKPLLGVENTGIDAISGPTNSKKKENETVKTISELHTTHGNFSTREISDDDLEVIKDACIRAANSSNMQTYSVIVVRDRQMMLNICGYKGSCLMLLNIDYNRLIDSAKSLNLPYFPGNITGFITAAINVSLVAQSATITARSLGIDSLITNGIHRGDMNRLWTMLELPEKHCFPLMALVLGYADKASDSKVGRLSGNAIFHEGKYHVHSLEEINEIVQQYDIEEKHLGLNNNWKESGYDHYLQWLFKEWLARDAEPVKDESQLFVQLKKRGFLEFTS